MNHPQVSGNKWWKLKYNLEYALKKNLTILTFGGAYSNHLYATAKACNILKIKSIGVVRGERTLPLNSTLAYAESCDMKLHYISRRDYKNKGQETVLESLRDKFGDFYLIGEGGTNDLAIKGCAEWATMLQNELEFDYVCLAVGTGGTIAGLSVGLDKSKKIIGIPVLKGAQFLESEIRKYKTKENVKLIYDYHFGGYAKKNKELLDLISNFESSYSVPFEPIYTGKVMFGVLDLIFKGYFEIGSRVLVLHTGGLQNFVGNNFNPKFSYF